MAQVTFIGPTGPHDGPLDYDTASYWSAGTVPGLSDDVRIIWGGAPIVETNIPAVHSLYVGAGIEFEPTAYRSLTTLQIDGSLEDLSSLRGKYIYGDGRIYTGRDATLDGTLGHAGGNGIEATSLTISTYDSGDLHLNGGSAISQFAGTFGGTGTIDLHHGTYNLVSGAQLSVSNLTVSGANVYFGADFTYAGHLSMSDGGLYLGAFGTGPDTQLTLTGQTTLTGGVIVGGGTDSVLNLKGSTTLSGFEQVSGDARVVNYGDLTLDGASVTLGAEGQGGATLVNAKGGHLFLSGGPFWTAAARQPLSIVAGSGREATAKSGRLW